MLSLFCTRLTAQEIPSGAEISSSLHPENGVPFTIRQIIITGNKRTNEAIILREIPFKTGEHFSLQELLKQFEKARIQLMNTSLFHYVTVAMKGSSGYEVDVEILVKERWYIFPLPYVRPVDRNLNQWLFKEGASLDRVDYGIKLMSYNTTGDNDKFRLWLINGYTKQISASYDRPYIDKNMKWGLITSFSIGKNREINYNTIDDKQAFYKDDDYVRSFVTAGAAITYRPAIKTRHQFGINYIRENIKDTVIALNPEYFNNDKTHIAFPELYYKMKYYDLDYIPYPTKGYAAEVTVGKKGLNKDVNQWYLTVKGSGTWPTGKRTFFNVTAFGSLTVPFKQPYMMQRLLGYNDAFMQGYEYYVIDGAAGGFLKTTFTRELFNLNVKKPYSKNASCVPFRFYGKVYGNAGYVYNPEPGDNYLSNRILCSGGIGLDILTAYDFTIKLEWTFNQLGQNGLFLHRKSIF
ncbi:MAG TPA: POTRA domain-containing protein [Chitinophagaceae bacterium]